MGITIEHECPQCGGPIDLDETDRILCCPYCSVKNYLFTPDYFRFVLPHKAPDKELFYVPYLRFKGNVYFCRDLSIGRRFVDITHVGSNLRGVPVSLGLRPQAMKMKFVTPDTQGAFLKFSLKAADIVSKAARLSTGNSTDGIFHRAFIGETLSLIYMPLFLESGKLYDGILNLPMTNIPQDPDFFESRRSKNAAKWKLSFLPTLCPKCGWNLEGEFDSVALTCGNCDTAWEASNGEFRQVNALAVPGLDRETRYLPFWRIKASCNGIQIHSFADFIRVVNQPLVIQKEWENHDMCFWSPAFKIRPKLFLNLAKQVTVSQFRFQEETKIPAQGLHPVTLPREESIQALKLILASAAVNKKNVLPHLPMVRFEIEAASLVYLPFTDTGHEWVLQNMRISINKQSLEFGRRL